MTTQPNLAQSTAAFTVEAGGSRTGQALPVVGEQMFVKISSRDTNGAFAVIEDYTPPQGGPPLHRHLVQDEWWYILEGQFLFEVDGKEIHVGPGMTVFARHGSCHAFQNVGTTMGRSLVTVVPGGLDIFFEEISKIAPSSAAQLDPKALAALFAKHGLELLGPPLAARDKNKS